VCCISSKEPYSTYQITVTVLGFTSHSCPRLCSARICERTMYACVTFPQKSPICVLHSLKRALYACVTFPQKSPTCVLKRALRVCFISSKEPYSTYQITVTVLGFTSHWCPRLCCARIRKRAIHACVLFPQKSCIPTLVAAAVPCK